jgi:thiamine-phosphate pyrophosphorylase
VSESSIVRVVDENLNRLAEGLRVLEDIARMVLNETDLTAKLKNLRHDLIRSDLPFNLELLRSRNSAGDIGAGLEEPGQNEPQKLSLIVVANARRAQESLRVLEETAKLPEMAGKLDTNKFKQARFALYSIEKELVERLARQDKLNKISGLYVVLDTSCLKGRRHLEVARELIEAGVKVIQLRDKVTPKNQLLPVARELANLCRQQDVLLIINDHLDVALAVDADGLHVGQTDLPAEVARRLLPQDKILGVSAATVEEARAAEASGADYLGVGCVYPTTSKEDAEPVGVERVREIRQATLLPLAAIGGINPDNVKEVIAAGADAVCVISAVLNAEDVGEAARKLTKMISESD